MTDSEATTARKRMDERISVFSVADTVSGAIDAIAITDMEGIITYANPSMEKTYGYKKGEMIGKSVSSLNPDSEMVREIIPTLKKEGSWNGEILQQKKNKETFHALLSLSTIKDEEGKPTGMMAAVRDVTEQKRVEDALRESKKRYQRLVKDLEAKNAELERFTYTVSHDLRSPLVTIQGFINMLRMDVEGKEKEKVEIDLKMIGEAATKMNILLTETLNLSRIGRVVNPPEDVSFGELVQEALEQTAGEIGSNNIEVSVAEDFPLVHADSTRIVEVLVNLIGNSINYMGEQPRPKIDIGHYKNSDENVFFVCDNGIGIDQSQHEKVFGLFYQVNRNKKGSGAGLAIVKRIIEVHGGRVWIESEKGKGCTVCFTLPPEMVKK